MIERTTIFVERIGVRKNGQPSIRTVKHHWAVCDTCGEGTWVLARDLKKTKTDQRSGKACRMTPHCSGKHRR